MLEDTNSLDGAQMSFILLTWVLSYYILPVSDPNLPINPPSGGCRSGYMPWQQGCYKISTDRTYNTREGEGNCLYRGI